MPDPASPISGSDPGPLHPVRHPFRSKFLGYLLIFVSPPIAIYLFLKILAATGDERWWFLGGIFLFLATYGLITVGRKLSATVYSEAVANDPRPPVVYLRPFRADDRKIASAAQGTREGGVATERSTAYASRENTIRKALSGLGPFVAVGRPGEWLTHAGGATRLYLSDDNWKQVVESLVLTAAAVVLQPESTEGTLWEVELVAHTVDLRRVLLIVPNPRLRPFGFAHVYELIAQRFRVQLPSPEDWPRPPIPTFSFSRLVLWLSQVLNSVLSVQPEGSLYDAVYFDRDRRSVAVSLAYDPTVPLTPFVNFVRDMGGAIQEPA